MYADQHDGSGGRGEGRLADDLDGDLGLDHVVLRDRFIGDVLDEPVELQLAAGRLRRVGIADLEALLLPPGALCGFLFLFF